MRMGLKLMLAGQSLLPLLLSSNITDSVPHMLKCWTEKRFSLLKVVSHSGPMFSHLQKKQLRFLLSCCGNFLTKDGIVVVEPRDFAFLLLALRFLAHVQLFCQVHLSLCVVYLPQVNPSTSRHLKT